MVYSKKSESPPQYLHHKPTLQTVLVVAIFVIQGFMRLRKINPYSFNAQMFDRKLGLITQKPITFSA